MRVFFIAEAANNHGGSLEKAFGMVNVAKEAGADAVKFQFLDPEEMCGPDYPYRDEFERMALGHDNWPLLKEYCDSAEIEFMATPFSLRAVDVLEEIGIKRYKVASGDITFLPLLERVARTGKPVILSTGGARQTEVYDAVRILRQNNLYPSIGVIVMKCTMTYPCAEVDVNLAGMETLYHESAYGNGIPIGLSDHTKDGFASILAVAAGASVIEKHFYLDKDPEDGSSSPDELAHLISQVRRAEIIMGSHELGPKECEEEWLPLARRDPTTWRREWTTALA